MNSYETILSTLEEKHKRMTGPPVALFYSYHEQEMNSDAASGIPIRGRINTEEVTTITVPQNTAY
ncbi:MAG: hypothetical protein JXL67_13945 [Calditrichaeota bacterium]|nr:hypothetical protein [Calditrichota bacterium]